MATQGCPLGTHPAHLEDNRNCVLCLTCVQACPHRSVQLSLRPPAADIQREMSLPPGEPGLLLVLADAASRSIIPGGAELPVGIITALLGGVFFLYLLQTRRERFWHG